MIKKVKTLCCRHMLLAILTDNKFLKRFAKKNCRKQMKRSLELKKY